VEETLALYLSPKAASSLKVPSLPSKPCRTSIGGKSMVAGGAGACLHTMGIMHTRPTSYAYMNSDH